MQNQLFEIFTGKRKGIIVDAGLTNQDGKDVPINKFLFKENKYLGGCLKVLQNIPDGYTLSALIVREGSYAPESVHFIADGNEPFRIFKLDDVVDCFVVSGKFKLPHNYTLL